MPRDQLALQDSLHFLRRGRQRHLNRMAAVTALAMVLASTVTWFATQPATESVVIALRGITPAAPITAGDVALRRVPRNIAPEQALRSVAVLLGRRTNSPVAAGEIVTRARLRQQRSTLGTTLLVAVPVDAATAESAAEGDVVDVFTTVNDATTAQRVAHALLVAKVKPADGQRGSDAVVYLRVPANIAATLMAAKSRTAITVAVLSD